MLVTRSPRPTLVEDHFDAGLSARWERVFIAGGWFDLTGDGLRLGFDRATHRQYVDAQIDDYFHLSRWHYPWLPPLRLRVRARVSHPVAPGPGEPDTPLLAGTAGFGFWNFPLSLQGRAQALPEAIWFFYASPPSAMALVPGLPGWGWKAQVVHARRWGALAAVAPTTLAVLGARLTQREQMATRWLQRFSGTREALLTNDPRAWADYDLAWTPAVARFAVNGREVLRVASPPPGPLGFVAWIDNQFALATPRGELRFGLLDTGPQWLELAAVRIERMA
jgi:hypothetical protein